MQLSSLLFYIHQYLKPLNCGGQHFADLFPEADMGVGIKGGLTSVYNDELGTGMESLPGHVGSWGDYKAGSHYDKEIALP